MTMKITAWITLAVFGLFDCSCVVRTVTMERAADVALARDQDVEVLAVFTTAGETIEFAEGYPGHIRDDVIKGYVADPAEVTLGKTQINRTIHDAGGRTVSVRTKDRKKYIVERITAETADSLSFLTVKQELVSVPLSDVDMVSVRRIDESGSIGAVLGVTALAVVVLFAVAAASKKSPQNPLGGMEW